MSDAALDDDARLQYEAEPDERFASLERDLAKQREDTNDMFSAIQASIAALTAAQSAPKRAKLPETPKTTPYRRVATVATLCRTSHAVP
jgi:chromatin segregation and condensation protein Rec8/ScpA/Scc1 (kleisin family)